MAPEPDMRARMQPSTLRDAAMSSPMTGTHGDGRRLEVVAGFAEPEAELRRARQRIGEVGQAGIVAALEPAEDVGGDHRHAAD